MDLMEQYLERPKSPGNLREAVGLVHALWDLFNGCRHLVLELRDTITQLEGIIDSLKANSTNSSAPPSQDRLSGKRDKLFKKKPSGKKRGAQEGHARNVRPQVPESDVDEVQRHFPDARCPCGGQLEINPEPQSRHQIFDLPKITYTVTEHQRLAGVCPCCNQKVIARLPQEVPTGQMGPGLIAWIALMNGHFRLSTRNIQSLLEMQWGLRFSTGAISESQKPVADWLEPLHQQVGDIIRQAPVAHADETTHFQGKTRQWLWVLCTTELAFFMVHVSRGMKAASELLGCFSGILVTDRHGGYNHYPAESRQICWAHVIRKLERITGRKGDPGDTGRWLVRCARIIIQLEHRWRKSGYQSSLYRKRIEYARLHFRLTLEYGTEKHKGKRAANVCQKLLAEEPMLWRFLQSPGLALTNNHAERAIRPYVIWRKTSFFSQSEQGDLFRARVMTVSESCRRLDLCAYTLLREVCEQGIRKQPITIRLPIDHLYQIPPSHRLEHLQAA